MKFFTSSQTFNASGEFIPTAMKMLKEHFEEKGFKYRVKSESYGRTIIEIQRGNFLHQALGLRHGMEITFTRDGEDTDVEIRDCLIENQLIGPSLIFYYLPKMRIPIAITDSIGLALQVNLPEKAMAVVDEAYHECTGASREFCPHCGTQMGTDETRCSECGYAM